MYETRTEHYAWTADDMTMKAMTKKNGSVGGFMVSTERARSTEILHRGSKWYDNESDKDERVKWGFRG